MKKKLFISKQLLLIVLMTPIFLFSQNNLLSEINESKSSIVNSNLTSMKLNNDNEKVTKVIEQLRKTNDSILTILKGQNKENFVLQKILYENNYKLLQSTFQEIKNTNSTIDNYRQKIAITSFGAILSSLNNPTNSQLGISFSSVITENSKNILSRDLSGNSKNNFLQTIDRIVKMPIITTALNSNPISSLISGVFQQAVGFDKNKISTEAILEFNNSIKPYVEFYEKLDSENKSFKEITTSYSIELSITENNFNNYKNKIFSSLNTDEDKFLNKIDEFFQKNATQNLTIDDYKKINTNPEVNVILNYINKNPIVIVNQEKFLNSVSSFIKKNILILQNLTSDPKIKFNKIQIDQVIEELKRVDTALSKQ